MSFTSAPGPTRPERFEAVAAEVYEPIQRYVRRRHDPDSVDDVVAEVLATVWRRLDDVPVGAELPWAYGVARRALANARRGDERRLRLLRRLESEPATGTGHEPAVDADLHTALGRLPAADREILRLWAWESLEPTEIAVVLGISSNAAAIRLHRAKRKVAEALESVRKTERPSGHEPIRDTEEGRT